MHIATAKKKYRVKLNLFATKNDIQFKHLGPLPKNPKKNSLI
jgi:hypothetical protein